LGELRRGEERSEMREVETECFRLKKTGKNGMLPSEKGWRRNEGIPSGKEV